MVTIAEVAARAGVSRATAARALSGSGSASEAARRAVATAAEELAYVPNYVARSLRTRSTGIIGLLISDVENPFYSVIAREVAVAVNAVGLHVVLCNTSDDERIEREYLELLSRMKAEGVIVTPTGGNKDFIRLVNNERMTVVQLDRSVGSHVSDAVVLDNRRASRTAVQHLLDRGHRAIAIIMGPASIGTAQDRLSGYVDALKENGLNIREDLIRAGSFLWEHGWSATKALLALEARPSAIIAGNGVLAEGSIWAVREAGLSVPEDMSILAFDDPLWMRMVVPQITTVRQPIDIMARMAANFLLERLAGSCRGVAAREVICRGELLVRGSTEGTQISR